MPHLIEAKLWVLLLDAITVVLNISVKSALLCLFAFENYVQNVVPAGCGLLVAWLMVAQENPGWYDPTIGSCVYSRSLRYTSLSYGLCTFTAVPRSTHPSTLWDGEMCISFWANKWQWWIVESYLWLTAQVSWLGLKVASRLVVSLQSVFSKCTGQTLAVALSTELYILCWSELSRHKPSPTSATAHYSSPDGAIGLVSRCQLSRYVKLDYFLEAARLKFLHRPCNPAFVRCYVNMLTCAAINICKNKRFKGCGKTFLV